MESSIAQKILIALSGLYGPYAYAAILGMLFVCGLGVPLPEDITLVAAGMLAATKSISLTGAFIAGYVGVLLGDVLLFMIGRRYGRQVFQLPVFRKIFTEDRIVKAEQKIQKNAKMICFFARFLPGLRAPIYLTAGILKVRVSVFLFQDGLAALLSVPVWVYLGYLFGENMELLLTKAKQAQVYVMVAVVIAILTYVGLKVLPKKPRTEVQ